MNTLYIVPPVFFVISTIFSMLGMGGGQLYIPILFWLGMDFKTEAIPLGLFLNMVNSGSSAFTYAREKMINWRVGIPFGITMLVFAPLGTWLNIKLPTKPVVLMFALFTAAAGILMLSGWKPQKRPGKRAALMIGLFGGSFLGFLTGLIGRGGGSFVVPLLYMLGLEPKIAAATSSMVVNFSATSAFISHLATAAHPQWSTWIACIVAVFTGSRVGSHIMAKKLKPRAIKYIFGWVLIGVAVILILQTYYFHLK